MDSDSDNDCIVNMLNEIDNELDINDLEKSVNQLCEREIFFEDYKKNNIEIKYPRKKNDIEIMDLIHEKIKKQINKKIELEKQKEIIERDRVYNSGFKFDQIKNLYDLDNIPDPVSYKKLLKKKEKKKCN